MAREVTPQDHYASSLSQFFQSVLDGLDRGKIQEDLSDLHLSDDIVLSGAMFLNRHFLKSGVTVLAAATEDSAPFVKSAAGMSGYTTPVRAVTVRKRYIGEHRQIEGGVQPRDRIGLIIGALTAPEPLMTAFEAFQEKGGIVIEIVALVCDPKARARFVSLSQRRCCGVMSLTDLKNGSPSL